MLIRKDTCCGPADSCISTLASFTRYQEQTYFPILDGLRALSILLVTLEHARGREQWLLLRGLNGVTIFFVISGFLITTLCLREESKNGRVDMKAFYKRRAFRILPLYYLALGLYTFLIVIRNIDPPRRLKFISALPYFATYLQEIPHYFFPNVPFEFAWSLAIEEKFYLAWPALVFIALRNRPAFRVPLALTLLFACSVPVTFSPYGQLVINYSHILAGCTAAILMHQAPSFEQLRVLGQKRWLWSTCLAAVALHFLTSIAIPQLTVLFSISVTIALTALLQSGPTWIHAVLESGPLLQLGKISYGVYLFHSLCLHAVAKVFPIRHGVAGDLAVWLLGVALAIIAAAILHQLVETPLIQLGRGRARSGRASRMQHDHPVKLSVL